MEPSAITEVLPLTGGVASDIAMVDAGDKRFCIKFALPKLKVAEDWHAPVHRNRAEYEWLRTAAQIAPECAVKTFGRSDDLHGFAMEFISGDAVSLWKKDLLEGKSDSARPAAVGGLVGRIHAASSRPDFDTAPFQNRDDFHALRIEPYLVFTAGKHAEVSSELRRIAESLYKTSKVLVHGDVSPKNILFRAGKPIILDAECATMGAPEFDVAFCLNHLVLKAQHVSSLRADLATHVNALWSAYAETVSWEPETELEARVSRLLPALLLARVDGKSPVEYLDEGSQGVIRDVSLRLLMTPKSTIVGVVDELLDTWKGDNP
ncbi:aminoglycoside phosphotransferase family protein [uncultured Roseibium sp.]|uniref:phosphotransferase n=1 Tax=uncultured Roseibium sp. TaxID=1936171 RepID=UPI002601B5F5|nr:aminoglycoside phosphotransferase family protein [uncultured Roseibium sp.]